MKSRPSAGTRRAMVSPAFSLFSRTRTPKTSTSSPTISVTSFARNRKREVLVDQMIDSSCRLLRIRRLEALAFEQILTEPGSGADPDASILGAIYASGNALDKLQRYAAAAERSYYKVLRDLQ